jgi:(p)ppGpp synthase/HD superfamily hydrolase
LQNNISLFLKAIKFSAEKHRNQRRKDERASPYIKHTIEVANVLWTIGDVCDRTTIVGAILHDALEDTNTTHEEISINFGTAGVLYLPASFLLFRQKFGLYVMPGIHMPSIIEVWD